MTNQILTSKNHYVYIHLSKKTGKVMYVGYGTKNRAWSFPNSDSPFSRPYNKEDVEIEILEYFNKKETAIKYEELITKKYKRNGEAFFNKKAGDKILDELKEKNYLGKNNPNFNNKWTKEQKSSLSGKNNGMFGKPSPTRRKCVLIMPNGESVYFNFVGEAYKYFKENFGLSMGKVKELLKTGEPYKTHYSKYKHLEGMTMKYIEETAPPKIVIISATDRAGKDTMINEIDRQTKYKHMTMDRGPDAFQAYCDIFDKGEELKDYYKEMEKRLSDNPDVLAIYIDCSTEELERRCKETDHEILDFDYHKSFLEYYFDESEYKNKIKIDTTNTHVKEHVKNLIEQGIL